MFKNNLCKPCKKYFTNPGIVGHNFFVHSDTKTQEKLNRLRLNGRMKIKWKQCKRCKKIFKNKLALSIHKYVKYTKEGRIRHKKISPKGNKASSTPEVRAKISKSMKGMKNSLGHKMSKERKLQVSRQMKGKQYVLGNHYIRNYIRRHGHVPYSKSGYRKDLGHSCRSRWEANFARVLNYKGIKYKYEPCFDLGKYMYLPDFYLIDLDIYIEVKGYDSELAKEKRKRLVRMYDVKLKLLRLKKYVAMEKEYSQLIPEWEFSK